MNVVIQFLSILLIVVVSVLLTRLYLKCTIKRCVSTVSTIGKVIIVTGANSGIGYYTAKDLAARGGRVILACRHETRAQAARKKIIDETGNTNVIYKHLNLSSLQSVRNFAEDVKATEQRLDVLINNAGAYGLGNRYTDDGILEVMQINYFAPFLLTLLLLPLLKKNPSRIINVGSISHFLGEINLEHINTVGYYLEPSIYSNSKMCSLLFTVELAKRLGSSVAVNAVHPGVIFTKVVPTERNVTRVLFRIWTWICCRTAQEGAQTSIHLAVDDVCADITGKYYADCAPCFMSWKARDENLRKELWEYSEKLTGLSDHYTQHEIDSISLVVK